MNYKTLTGLQNLFKSVVRPKSSGDFSAWLGNAQGVVVADDNNGVYIMDWNGNVRVVLNNKVPPYPFRPVRVGYVSESNKTLEVKEFIDAYPTQRPPNVPKHAGNHVWGGVDSLFIRGEQILPGVAIPDDDDPLVLHVAGFVYYLNGWHIIDSFTLDVTSYIPSSGAKFLLLEADDAGAITVQSGTAVDIREELVMEDIPSPTLGTVPLVAVMVYAGQVKIWKTLSKQDVVDLRWSRYATGLDTSITAPLYAGRHVAAADPTVTDDDTAGFLPLYLWLNSTTGDRFICTDNSTGAAVWESLAGGGGGGVATVTGALVDNTDPLNPVVDLIVPTTTDLGGVKRNTGSAGQFVNGISATGELEYDTPAGGGGREILSADRAYYIRTDGSDSNDGLTNSAGGAFLTIAKLNAVIATLDKNGYDVDAYFGAGTWSVEASVNLGIGEGVVRWHGTLTLVETASSATVAAGSGGTAGTVTKTGQFTGDTHKGLLAYFVTNDQYRVIYSNTNNALTLADLAPSSTTQDVSVYSWGTIINRLTVPVGVGNFEIYGLHFQGDGTYSLYQNAYSAVTIYYCQFNDQIFLYNSNNPFIYDSYFYETAAIPMITPSLGATGIFQRCFIRIQNNTGTGMAANRGAQILIFGGTVDGVDGANKATYGVRAWGNATVQFSSGTGIGNVKVYNCDAGVRVDIGGVMVGTSSGITNSGNTANTSNDGTGVLA